MIPTVVKQPASASHSRVFALACVVFAALAFSERQAHAQAPDGLLNGVVIGAVVGTGVGVAFTHAVRDSDLGVSQYAYGALVFGAIGAGVGIRLQRQATDRPTNSEKHMLIV